MPFQGSLSQRSKPRGGNPAGTGVPFPPALYLGVRAFRILVSYTHRSVSGKALLWSLVLMSEILLFLAQQTGRSTGGMQTGAPLGIGLWSCALGSLFPLDNGTVSPLCEPEGCVSHGRGCALLRWMHLSTGQGKWY